MVTLFGNQVPPEVSMGELTEIAARIRLFIARLVDERLALSPQQNPPDDILQAVVEARDPDDGSAFSAEELVNQISVLFLAGHETSASVLTWCFFILSQQPQLAEKIRNDTIAFGRRAAAEQDELVRAVTARDTFREALRLLSAGRVHYACFDEPCDHLRLRYRGWHTDRDLAMALCTAMKNTGKIRIFFDPERFSEARERDIVAELTFPSGSAPASALAAPSP